ncbi:MAG TPA: uracil-DNA glycosylase [Candidatus Aminicenantes bacterium]|nr:uracil-DNA glycosylase [Candidatus Aminicenantes bacterium]
MVMDLKSREKISALLNVRKDLGNCKRCQLSQGRTNIVFGEGNPFADLMIIGEAPGEREDQLARPFVGRSGELLDEALTANDLTRDDVYIANIIKCRPPANRNPSLTEMGTCAPFLYKQIETIAPKCVVTLGKVATEYLLQRNIKITQERGRALSCSDFPHIFLIPALHPSYILRGGGKDKSKLIQDIGYGLDLTLIGVTPTQMR